MNRETFDYRDILIVPETVSKIKSRSETYPYYPKGGGRHLPLITAPMDTVVNANNAKKFLTQGVNVCLPRGERFLTEDRIVNGTLNFESISLEEFNVIITNKTLPFMTSFDGKYYVCIDIANGHMEYLHNMIKQAKSVFGKDIVIMAGNIANPKTYELYCELEVDYARIGIGNGNGCLTTQQTGVGYPLASLIAECYQSSLKFGSSASKIVADGGIKSYSDIYKALALGANYVMIGSIFNKCLESAGDTYFGKFKLDQYGRFAKYLLKNGFVVTKKFRGMSTKEVQRKWGKTELRTSEGISTKWNVEYFLDKWVDNFIGYLKTNLSYCNCVHLDEIIGKPITIRISEKAYQRFNK